uniref:Phospholipase D n=1 Tax=Rhizophora mucronata TaxID=61149 RepID=A0A2P2K5J3_RHIMU
MLNVLTLEYCRMESWEPMMKKHSIFSSIHLCKCYFVPVLLGKNIAGSSKGKLEPSTHIIRKL